MNAIEAENGVIGSILIDARCLPSVLAHVGSADFQMAANKDIFETASGMFAAQKPIDVMTISAEMKTLGLHTESTTQFMLGLMEVTPTAANAEEYAKITAENASRRRTIEKLEESLDKIRENQNSFEVSAELVSYLVDQTKKKQSNGVIPLQDAFVDFLITRDKVQGGEIKTISTGYRKLDMALGGGMIRGGFYIMAARPGIGKTTISINMAIRAAEQGTKVFYVPLEMTPTEMTAKLLSTKTGISSTKLSIEAFAEHEMDACYEKIATSVHKMQDLPLYFYDTEKGMPTVAEICAYGRLGNFDLIVIDYIGLMKKEKGKDMYERMSATSVAIKQAALSLKVPILALSQLNREVEGRGGKPRISDLRDSGSLEQDADAIFLLEMPRQDREENPLPDTQPEELLMHVAKNRRGRLGVLRYDFYLKQGIVHEAAAR